MDTFDWGVIIPGRWNQAILTPAGIAKYVFDMPVGAERIWIVVLTASRLTSCLIRSAKA